MDNRWFYRVSNQAEPRLRLFCFPYAGASAPIFRPWQPFFPNDIDVVATQLPGRGFRFEEPLYRRLDPLIDDLIDAIRPGLDRPFVFFGHSLGALVAFELTHKLRQSGGSLPRGLILSGKRPPHLPSPRPPRHQLSESGFLDELRKFGGTPEVFWENPDIMELFLPSLKADFELVETYVATDKPPLDIPFAVFGGEEDPEVPVELLENWRPYTRQACPIYRFPGAHFFIDSARTEVLRQVERTLSGWMEQSTYSYIGQ